MSGQVLAALAGRLARRVLLVRGEALVPAHEPERAVRARPRRGRAACPPCAPTSRACGGVFALSNASTTRSADAAERLDVRLARRARRRTRPSRPRSWRAGASAPRPCSSRPRASRTPARGSSSTRRDRSRRGRAAPRGCGTARPRWSRARRRHRTRCAGFTCYAGAERDLRTQVDPATRRLRRVEPVDDVVVERVLAQVRDREAAHAAGAHDLDRDATHVAIGERGVDVERVVGRETVVGDVRTAMVTLSLLDGRTACRCQLIMPEASRRSAAHQGSVACDGVRHPTSTSCVEASSVRRTIPCGATTRERHRLARAPSRARPSSSRPRARRPAGRRGGSARSRRSARAATRSPPTAHASPAARTGLSDASDQRTSSSSPDEKKTSRIVTTIGYLRVMTRRRLRSLRG